MAGIKQPMLDIMTQLGTIQALTLDNKTVPLYVRIFNNQPKKKEQGKMQAYQLPAAFVEVLKPVNHQQLLNQVADSDLVIAIHIEHWQADAGDGTMEQDLGIFDLRDAVIACMVGFQPTGCGHLMLTAEGPDYDHDNLYVYIVEFTANFTDTKGSPYDAGRNIYINSTSPTNVSLDVDLVDEITE
jgi:hypothetical protein